MNKKELRKEGLARRSAMSQMECIEKSKKIASKVIELEAFQKCNKVLLYASAKNEVETADIFEEAKRRGKDIYYPRVMGEYMEFYHINEKTEFEMSAFGIREPKPETTVGFIPSKKDSILIVVPGVVFDEDGNRIGYGGGYYDKYIGWLENRIPASDICKVAVAYECQMVECGRMTVEPHDSKIDFVLTET